MNLTHIEEDIGKVDEFFKQAVEMVVNYDRASASLIQRRLQVGYARAATIIDQLEAAGVVGPAEGSNPREVLIRSPKELFGDDWEKLTRKEETKVPVFEDSPKDPFSNIHFWFKVLKLSLVILVPYWLFGFEAGILVRIISTLVRKLPTPIKKIIGDLSNTGRVLVGLNVRESE